MQVVIGLNTGVGILNRFAQSLATELSRSNSNRCSEGPAPVDAPVACEDTNGRRRQFRFLPSNLLTLKVETLINLVRDAGDTGDVVATFAGATNGREKPEVWSLRILQMPFDFIKPAIAQRQLMLINDIRPVVRQIIFQITCRNLAGR